MKKILMILTSHKDIGGKAETTGVWLGEFTDPYYEFIDRGYQVTLASPKGGEPPLDPRSTLTENITSSNRRYHDDPAARQAFKNTTPLHGVYADDYDAVFYPGGHGPMYDLATDETNASLVARFFEQRKPIGAVCHGPAALLRAAELNPGILLGRDVTGFSNTEETLMFIYDTLPLKLEDKLKEAGAKYHSALIPMTSKVVTDGLIVTGQNPASASATATALIEVLEAEDAVAKQKINTTRDY